MNFHLFDVITDSGEYIADKPLRDRHSRLVSFVADIDSDYLKHVALKFDLDLAMDEAFENDDEGIIVKDYLSEYEFAKRSAYWQKIKIDDETVDVLISDFEEGTGEASGTLGAVALETSDGVYVGKSGSGFSDELRDEIWNNQDEWYGRTVEIEARGISPDENKLRMPIFVRDRSADGTSDSLERVKELMKEI
jgi:DNA ligase-1